MVAFAKDRLTEKVPSTSTRLKEMRKAQCPAVAREEGPQAKEVSMEAAVKLDQCVRSRGGPG